MKIGLIGFKGSGKTTLFNALTGLAAETGSYSKGGRNLGQIAVPEPRLDRLAEVVNPKKKTYATITFVDFAGVEMGEARAGLDPQAIGEMRTADALALVVRAFESPMFATAPSPAEELESLVSELVINDLVIIERRLERLAKEGGKAKEEISLLERLKTALDQGRLLSSLELRKDELERLAGFQFLTLKPLVAVLNVDESNLSEEFADVYKVAENFGASVISVPARLETELNELSDEERQEFAQELGITESAVERFVRTAFEALDLIVFFTTVSDECRCWTLKRGSNAVEAAARIHTDIARGFIRAEVIHWSDFEALGSEQECRKAGKVHLEGKEYIVQDGDIIKFRFNV